MLSNGHEAGTWPQPLPEHSLWEAGDERPLQMFQCVRRRAGQRPDAAYGDPGICRRRKTGRIVGAGPVRLSGHKLSFVCSMSPEIAGTVHSTVCALHLNKAGKEGEGVMCKTKLR